MSPERLAGRGLGDVEQGKIAGRLALVRARIAEAATRVGRDARAVRLVAVTKGVPVDRIREAAEAGATSFGENYVQEWVAKRHALGGLVDWHFIGRLQRNKAKFVAGKVSLVHAVDSIRLAEELGRRARAMEARQDCLIEVNVAGERAKAGFAPDKVDEAVRAIAELDGVRLCGLMTMPPVVAAPELSRKWFKQLATLRDRVASATGVDLPDLSMGMSSDFGVAVEEGATIVRVGTAIFGPRPGG